MQHPWVGGALLAAAMILSGRTGQAAETTVDAGRLIALENCARCHAVARGGESPMEEAPPFRRPHERYQIDDLAEALAEGIAVGHKEMPPFSFAPA